MAELESVEKIDDPKLSRSERYRLSRELNKHKKEQELVNGNFDEISAEADASVKASEELNASKDISSTVKTEPKVKMPSKVFKQALAERQGKLSQFQKVLAHRQGKAEAPKRDFKSELAFRQLDKK